MAHAEKLIFKKESDWSGAREEEERKVEEWIVRPLTANLTLSEQTGMVSNNDANVIVHQHKYDKEKTYSTSTVHMTTIRSHPHTWQYCCRWT